MYYVEVLLIFWRVSCLQRGVPTKIEWSSSIILNKLFWMISLFPFVKSSASLKYKYQWHGIWFRFKLGRGPLRAGISGPLGQLVRLILKIPQRRKSRSEPIGPEMFAYALTKQYCTSYIGFMLWLITYEYHTQY